jgi:pimeloyl-ACP methyl ester carboxylesterase
MPTFDRHDVHLHYTLAGDPAGPPVLCIAPGGMRSAAAMWSRSPWNPLERLTGHRVIGMDQRNAGRSTAPIRAGDGWHTYTADQLALLDHLGVDQFDIVGMCIGGSYIMALIGAAPERVRSAVMMQPIGLHDNRDAFFAMFDAWAPKAADSAAIAGLRQNMFGGDDLLFSAGEAELAACTTPLLVLMGSDLYHPEPVSRRVAELAPKVTFVETWKSDPEATDAAIQAFLAGAA